MRIYKIKIDDLSPFMAVKESEILEALESLLPETDCPIIITPEEITPEEYEALGEFQGF